MPGSPPNLLQHLDEVSHILQSPRLGVAVDFDGTISEIVPDPAAAVVWPDSAAALSSLARRLVLVAIVTGRAIEDVKRRADLENVAYVGNHGAQYLVGDRYEEIPRSGEGRDALVAVLSHLRSNADGPGVFFEDKGISASVHFRAAPDSQAARDALSGALDSAPDVARLEVFWGKMILELRAPTGLNKGYALQKLVREFDLDAAVFVGDDTTDGDAFSAMKEMAQEESRFRGLGVVVLGEDTPEALIATADYALNGVGEVATFLRRLDEDLMRSGGEQARG